MSQVLRGTARFSSWVLLAPLFSLTPALLGAQGPGETTKTANTASIVVAGTVLDADRGFVSGAEVTISGVNARAVTSDDGKFRIAGVPAGRMTIHARRLGYRPTSADVVIPSPDRGPLEIRLVAIPEVLPAVEVSTRREVAASRLAGFSARQARGVGHFYTREQLDNRGHSLVELIREVPSARVRTLRGGGRIVTFRGHCPPVVIIDGFPASAGTLDLEMIDLAGYEAVEIYSGTSTVPAELQAPRGLERCGVIALWGRPARGRAPARPKPPATRLPSFDLDKLLAQADVYSAETVDERATLVEGTLAPSYPEPLWRDRVGGRVLLEFVVSRNGDVEQPSVAVAAATHPMFATAAVVAISQAKFRPASREGHPVRQVVQLPVVFEIPGDRPSQ